MTLKRDDYVAVGPSRNIAADGTPLYVVWAEQWLVGGAMLARATDVPVATVEREDFHDAALGAMWAAIAEVAAAGVEPSLPFVAQRLNAWGEIDRVGGEPALAILAGTELAMAYSGGAALEAHAELVREWGEKRRRIDELAREVREVYAGKVVPAAHRFRGGVSWNAEDSDAQ